MSTVLELRWLLAEHGWKAGPRRHLPDGSSWWPVHREPPPPTAPSARSATRAATSQNTEAPAMTCTVAARPVAAERVGWPT